MTVEEKTKKLNEAFGIKIANFSGTPFRVICQAQDEFVTDPLGKWNPCFKTDHAFHVLDQYLAIVNKDKEEVKPFIKYGIDVSEVTLVMADAPEFKTTKKGPLAEAICDAVLEALGG